MNGPGDPTIDPTRRVKGVSGLGMVVVDPAGQSRRSVTLRAIAGDDGMPLDLYFSPQLVLVRAESAMN